MQSKKRLYLFPITMATTRPGGNTYMPDLIKHLSKKFSILNKPTRFGLLDLLLKMPNCDVIYFNWIEDVADRYGIIQVPVLFIIVLLSKLSRIKIVWFVHNNLSHKKKNRWLKMRVVTLMKRNADIILSHSGEVQVDRTKPNVFIFDHPIDAYKPIAAQEAYCYDLLIWGTVNPYKGVEGFLQFNWKSSVLQKYKVLIAGKFTSQEYYVRIAALKTANVTIENKILSEAEMENLFAESRAILFTYNSASVLSSAALCKTLTYGKTIIGPAVGAFKELGTKGLIYNYTSFQDLENILENLKPKETQTVYQDNLKEYIEAHSWERFTDVIANAINERKQTVYAEAVL